MKRVRVTMECTFFFETIIPAKEIKEKIEMLIRMVRVRYLINIKVNMGIIQY